MKEIKFRAWNPDNKNHPMVQNALFRCDARELLQGEGIYKNWVLMQFTGVTDSNGREIYEGDIVAIGVGDKTEDNLIMRVIYDAPTFRLVNANNTYGNFNIVTLKDSYRKVIKQEVIGNIFQNSSLLTSTKD